MTAFYRQRIHPLVAAASVSVILVSLLGAAALTGVLPASRSALLPRTEPLPAGLSKAQVATGAPGDAATAPTSVATLVSDAPAAGTVHATPAAAGVVDPDLRRAQDGARTPDGAPVYESAETASAAPGTVTAPAPTAPARSLRHLRAASHGSTALALAESPTETRGARAVRIYRETPESGVDGTASSGSSGGAGNAGGGAPGAWSKQHPAGAAYSADSADVVTDPSGRVVEAYPAPRPAAPDINAKLESPASQRQNYLAGLRQDSRQDAKSDARQDNGSANLAGPTSEQAMRARRRSLRHGSPDEASSQPAPEGVAARTGSVIGKTVGDTIDRTVAVIAGVLQGHKPVSQPSSQRYEPGTAADPLYR